MEILVESWQQSGPIPLRVAGALVYVPIGVSVDLTDAQCEALTNANIAFTVAPVSDDLGEILDLKVKDIASLLPDRSDADLDALLVAEADGRNRKGVIGEIITIQKERADT